tara:strand:- start:508 stop:741 length:234 start_codon:yes stop_codon:yes gene_type:complete
MKQTHYTRLVDYLSEYGSITSLDAIRDLGNTRLSATVFKLRKDGYNITNDFVDVPTRWFKDNGDRKFTQVVRYRLIA